MIRVRTSDRDGTLLVFTPRHVLKLLPGRSGRHLRRNEIAGNAAAMSDEFWRGNVVPVTEKLGGILAERCRPVIGAGAAEPLIDEKLRRLEGCVARPADQLVDTGHIHDLVGYGLDADVPSVVDDMLGGVRLPGSSAHGDFILGNIVHRNGALALIDWDCYRSNSSFLLDVCHFYVDGLCRATAKSWTRVVFEEFLDCREAERAIARFELPLAACVGPYAVNRSALEIAQTPGLPTMTGGQIEKHVAVHRRLSRPTGG